MKLFFATTLLIIITSCNNNTISNQIIGSWKLRDVIDYTGQNASDKLTFFKDSSATIELFANKKLVEKLNAKYNFDFKNKTLKMDYGKYVFTFNVLKLDNDEMILENNSTKKVDRYLRY